jgi:N-hydroxyarylamine O-acetyltransferase
MPPTDLNLEAYCARIGLRHRGPASLQLLREVIFRHTATIPFENLDIILGRPIRLDIASLQAKLVETKRGGYCTEQNTLLQAALDQMGFTVNSLLARVVLAAPADAKTPRTHMLLRVTLAEGEYLVDGGFGLMTPTAPLLLGSSQEQTTPHETYRLLPVGGETLLQAKLESEWRNIYRFSSQSSHPIDHEVANWFTSTRPDSLFTTNIIAALPSDGSRKTLLNGTMTVRSLRQGTERRTLGSEAALQQALWAHFGIELVPPDLATIYHALHRFSERPPTGFRID